MIDASYLNVIMIPTYVDGSGRRYADELWHKDLVRHLGPIQDMTLAAPRREAESASVPLFLIDPARLKGRLGFVDLPPCRSLASALLTMPRAMATLWKAVGEAEVVHIGVGGWPLSYGWFTAPMAKLRGKFLLTNLEAAGWRLGWSRPIRPRALVQAVVYEAMGRFCVNLSDMVTSTQSAYLREMLLPWRRWRGQVFSASWIDEATILSREQAEDAWAEKLRDVSRPLKLGFAANLTPSKGVRILLAALRILESRGVALELKMYGKGELFDECSSFAAGASGSVKLSLRGLLPYGPPFFEMLQSQDVVLLPSITDEQPRLIYDCFSQAVPVIASATTGISQCVTDGVDGKLVPPGDPEALADAIAWAADHRDALRVLGIASLDVARNLTHDQMHQRRAEAIQRALDSRRDRTARRGPLERGRNPLTASPRLRPDPLDPSPSE
jgi:glycosyltransferase involved in cell wall biosynthesis